ncbi:ATP-binding protein, partial [candidate division WOR-3 bacterium]|nr:ATP-binding protein [candidate division WOR-3 bacterium]
MKSKKRQTKTSEKKSVETPAPDISFLADFLTSGKKIFFLTGEPGSGKSFLLDSFLNSEDFEKTGCIAFKYTIDDSKKLALPSDFLDLISATLDSVYGLKGFERGETVSDKTRRLYDRFNTVNGFENPVKTLLIIDNAEKYPEITRFIPDSSEWFKTIISSAPEQLLLSWSKRWEKTEIEIADIKKGDLSGVLSFLEHKAGKKYVKPEALYSEATPLDLLLSATALEITRSTESEGFYDLEASCRKICRCVFSDKDRVDEALLIKHLSLCPYPVSGKLLSSILVMGQNSIAGTADRLTGLIDKKKTSNNDFLYSLIFPSFRSFVRKEFSEEIEEISSKFERFLREEKNDIQAELRKDLFRILAFLKSEALNTGKRIDPDFLKSFAVDMYMQTSDSYVPTGLISEAVLQNTMSSPRNSDTESELLSLLLFSEEMTTAKNRENEKIASFFRKFFREKPDDLQEALQIMNKLDDASYYGFAVLISLGLSGKKNQDVKKDRASMKSLFSIVFTRLSEGTADWRYFFSDKFMAFWVHKVLCEENSEDVWRFLTLGVIESEEKDKIILRITEEMLALKDPDGAFTLARKISDPALRARKYSEIAMILAQSDDPSRAMRILMTTEEIVNRSSVLSLVSKKLASMDSLEEALSIAESIEDPDDRFSSLSFVAVSYSQKKNDDSQNGNLYMNKALRLTDKIDDAYLKNKTVAQIAVKTSALELSKGLKILERIAADDHEMKSWAISEIAKHLSSNKENEKAMQLIADMPDNIYKSSALSHVAKNLYNNGMTEKALETADKIPYFGYRFQTLFEISRNSASNEDSRDPPLPVPDYSEKEKNDHEEKIIDFLASGNLEKAYKKIITLENQSEKIEIFIKIVGSGKEIENREERELFFSTATGLLKKMKLDLSAHLRVLSLIACAMSEKDRAETALIQMAEDLSEKSFLGGSSLKAQLLKDISDHLTRSINLTMTYQLIENPEEFKSKTELLESLVKLFIESSQIQCVAEISENLAESPVKSRIQTEIAWSYMLNGEKRKALELLKKIDNQIESDDSISKIAEKTALLIGPEESFSVIELISQEWMKKETVAVIALDFAKRRDYTNALIFTEKMQDKAKKTVLLAQIACAAFSGKDKEDYEKALNMSFILSDSISCEKQKSRALSEVASCLLKSDLVDKAIEVSENIKDPFEKFQTIMFLENWMLQKGYSQRALELSDHVYDLLNYIEDPAEKSEAYSEYIRNLIEKGDVEKAEKINHEVPCEEKKAGLTALMTINSLKKGESAKTFLLLRTMFERAERIQNRKNRARTLEDIFIMFIRENLLPELKKYMMMSYMTPEFGEDSMKSLYSALIGSGFTERNKVLD